MAKEPERHELTEDELAQAKGEELPSREAMSVIRGGGVEMPLPVDDYPVADPPKGVTPLDDPPAT